MNETTLKFNFDVSAFRLIGRELITDKITALVELVKNSYDANAENVSITFSKVNPLSQNSKIIIQDDGLGMSLNDIQNKWMVIGTASKRISRLSPPPHCRKLVGKKGIGRFAVDKLGSKLLLKTTKYESQNMLCLQNDWGNYEQLEADQLQLNFEEKKYFTDIENKVWEQEKENVQQGTILEITGIHDSWTETDIKRVYKELSKLISPYTTLQSSFNITIIAPDTKDFEKKQIKSFALDEVPTFKFELNFDEEKQLQEVLVSNKNGIIETQLRTKEKCGLVKMYLYYFNQDAKKQFRSAYPDERIDGIKIYRDGILTTPFVENVDEIDDKKDLLGIDKRRWSGFFDKISSRDLLGWIEISDIHNPDIIDATNRQGFVDNEAWQSLKKLIIEQIVCIEKKLKNIRDSESAQTKNDFKETKDSFERIKKIIGETKTDDEETSQNLKDLNSEINKLHGSLNKVQSDMAKTKKEKERQEDLMFSLVSLQTYAGMLSHIVKMMIGKIKRKAEFLAKWISEQTYNEQKRDYAKQIFDEMNNLDKAVEFLLRYSKDGDTVEDIKVLALVKYLIENIYQFELQNNQIKTEIVASDEIIIKYNKKALEDIFDNLISNSFKILKKKSDNRLIKITLNVTDDSLLIYFSNNGDCIPEEEANRIFNIFYTTTAEDGGAGLGLYIIKTRVEALNGTIELIENEFKPDGATFKIVIPFNRENGVIQ